MDEGEQIRAKPASRLICRRRSPEVEESLLRQLVALCGSAHAGAVPPNLSVVPAHQLGKRRIDTSGCEFDQFVVGSLLDVSPIECGSTRCGMEWNDVARRAH
jgi:hypothetical protein